MHFNIMIIGQNGRLQYEAALFVASLRRFAPDFCGKLIVAEPAPGPKWDHDPRMQDPAIVDYLVSQGAEITPFTSKVFGSSYPHGNKIEGLSTLPEGEPFIFFDSDTLITGPINTLDIDFNKPTASLKREGTWPEPQLYGPSYSEIWGALYDQFDLDFVSSLDLSHPPSYWERYLYFNAGWFYGSCPKIFGKTFKKMAQRIKNTPPDALICQSLNPWLDQVALPLVIHALGGGRIGPHQALDGDMACHWRVLSLLFARENDRTVEALKEVASQNRLKKVLKTYEPFKKMLYQNKGQKVRDMFDRDRLPHTERQMRQRLKRANLWLR